MLTQSSSPAVEIGPPMPPTATPQSKPFPATALRAVCEATNPLRDSIIGPMWRSAE